MSSRLSWYHPLIFCSSARETNFFHLSGIRPSSNCLDGSEVLGIFRLCLKNHFANEMKRDKSIAGKPGESTLRNVLYLHSGITESSYGRILDSLRKLCRLVSISNILSNHGISFARGNALKVSYRYGELFELDEFSAKDLSSNFVKKRDHSKVPKVNRWLISLVDCTMYNPNSNLLYHFFYIYYYNNRRCQGSCHPPLMACLESPLDLPPQIVIMRY